MRLVETLVVRDDADILDAHIAYHLNAGVDFVIATEHESRDGSAEVLELYAQSGHLSVLHADGEARESEWRTKMARLAATDHRADWVLDTDPDEFWWPRGENIKDALAAIPQRYKIVQGLVRLFLPRSEGGASFAERMIVRRSLDSASADAVEPLAWALRPLYRSDPEIMIDTHSVMPGRQPLRAWYPFEVLRFPLRDTEQAERRFERGYTVRSTLESDVREAWQQRRLVHRYPDLVIEEDELSRKLDDGTLVADSRLRDALRTLSSSDARAGGFALPNEAGSRLVFRAPDIVDDAAYAVECAAVGEVDLPRLEREIAELEARIAWLEARFWPRVLRRLTRLVRRSG